MIYKFNDEVYETESKALDAVYKYAEETFDDFIDDVYGDVELCGHTYNSSYVLKFFDNWQHDIMLDDYSYMLSEEIEELEEAADE